MRKHVIYRLAAAELDHGARGLDDSHPHLPVLVGDALHQGADQGLRLHVEVVCETGRHQLLGLLLVGLDPAQRHGLPGGQATCALELPLPTRSLLQRGIGSGLPSSASYPWHWERYRTGTEPKQHQTEKAGGLTPSQLEAGAVTECLKLMTVALGA